MYRTRLGTTLLSFLWVLLCLFAHTPVHSQSSNTSAGQSEENQSTNPDSEKPLVMLQEGDTPWYPFDYEEGDWERYIWGEEYRREYNSDAPEDDFVAQGLLSYSLGYGKSSYTKDSYKTSDISKPESRVIDRGFNQERIIKVDMEGQVDERVRVQIHHDSTADESENYYLIEYKAIEDDEFLQEAHIGNVLINVNNSKYAVYNSGSREALGFDSTLKKDNLKVKMFGSIFRSVTAVDTFTGGSQNENLRLKEYQYIKQTYYQLEPFKRYDGLSSVPSISSGNDSYNTLITFGNIPDNISDYSLTSVNIKPASLSLYYDDQIGTNNSSSSYLDTDGGYYDKLTLGTDYKINYTTGEITFYKTVSDKSRIYALYELSSGTTSDPSASTSVVSGKYFVFIKYGTSLDEDSDRNYSQNSDLNGDGLINYDVYEHKGVYSLGSSSISESNFTFSILHNGSRLSSSQKENLGSYSIDYDSGLIKYVLPRPFSALLSSTALKEIYSQNQGADVYRYSGYTLYLSYTTEERNYQLSHTNIVPTSISVTVDNRVIDPAKYTLDEISGIITFKDPDSPSIGENTEVEISYEYGEFANSTNAFMGGVRGDYRVNRNMSVGGTMLYTASPQAESVPDVGSEPEANLVLEGDTSLYFGPAKLKKAASLLTGKKVRNMPYDVKAYFEIAHSNLNINTFGKAMIDDMESSGDLSAISLSEKEWTLGSLPSGYDQSLRGPLYYKYYRSLSDLDTLKDENFTPYEIDYSVKPGPYNIKESYKETLSGDSGTSLVLDFDFTSGDTCASVVNSDVSSDSTDLSGLQYVVIWYKAAEGSGSVNLSLDVGELDEDSDGDSSLDTEDSNSNGYLDYDSSSSIFEDRGYLFDPDGEESTRVGGGPRLSTSTKGDGVLTSEDLNGNGTLDQYENIVSFPGSSSDYAANVDGTSGNTTLSVSLSDHSWKKAVIYLDRSYENFDETALEALSDANGIRLNVSSSSSNSGVIYIGSIKLVTAGWGDTVIDGVESEDTTKFRVSLVDSNSDSEYRSNSFLTQAGEGYKELYGSEYQSADEMPQEGALKIEYSSLGGDAASTEKSFAKSIDIINYNTLCFWINTRSYTADDLLRLYVLSSDDDYLVYTHSLDRSKVWQKLTFSINGDDDDVEIYGSPDLRHITTLKLEIEGNDGEIWVNNIHVRDPEDLTDIAYWSEGEFSSRAPMYVTKGHTPVGGNFTIKYIKRGVGRNFVSPGRTVRDLSEDAHELYTSLDILPDLFADASYVRELTITNAENDDIAEELWGKTLKQTGVLNTAYNPAKKFLPKVTVKNQITKYENWNDEEISDNEFEKISDRFSYAPSLSIKEGFDIAPLGAVMIRYGGDFSFNTQHIDYTSEDVEDTEDVILNKALRYQTSRNIFESSFTNKYYYIRPKFTGYSGEYVTYKGYQDEGSDIINRDLSSDFHFPFFYNGKNMKYYERGNQFDFDTGLSPLDLIAFNYSTSISYDENSFTDNDSSDDIYLLGYERLKDADLSIENGLSLPFNFARKKSPFLRNITLSYNREVESDETGIPYENEEESFFYEKYGFQRSFKTSYEGAYNMAKYPPWFFFTGRGNFAEGRDYVYTTFNSPLYLSDGTEVEDYSNAFLIKDSYTLSSFFNFAPLSLSVNSSLSQLSQREEIESVPTQLVQFSSGEDLNFNLMEIFNGGFFRPNTPGNSQHFATLSLGYTYTRNMIITSNIQEDNHIPSIGCTFGIDRKSITLQSSIDFIYRQNREFISEDDSERDSADDIYYDNLSDTKLNEKDKAYTFYAEYQSDIPRLYKWLSSFYRLYDYPMYTLSYEMLLNRYDYEYETSPEPYDMHLFTAALDLDVHKNIQGGLESELAFERFRNSETGNVYQEVVSFGLLFSLTILF
jgi:hypothetical protein